MSAMLVTLLTPDSSNTAQARIISTAARVSRTGAAERCGALPSAVNVITPAPPTRSIMPCARRASVSCAMRSRSVAISWNLTDELPQLSTNTFIDFNYDRQRSKGPLPIANLRQVVAVIDDIFLVIDQLVAHRLHHVRAD